MQWLLRQFDPSTEVLHAAWKAAQQELKTIGGIE
jgi:hypothetical protein